MTMLNRRTLLEGGLLLGAAALAPRLGAAAEPPSGTAAAGAHAAAPAAGPPTDAMAHVAPEFRAALAPIARMTPEFEKNIGNVAALRAANWRNPEQPAASPSVERRVVPGPKGAPDVPVYVINAQPRGAKQPLLLHIHGGGYIIGTAAMQIPALQRTAREQNCIVVTVDYRLAPETPFPGALEDNYAALRWLHGAADELGGDASRIAVMGESAGGGHAAMLALAARDRGEFPLLAQILIYPMLDDRTGSTRAVPAHIGQFLWTPAFNRYGWSSLLGVPAGSRHVPAGAVPARVANLAGLAPAFIGVGAIDLFVEEDMQYAQRLVSAGVPTELLVVPGAFHGFDMMVPDAPLSKSFRAAWSEALRRAFAASAATA